MNKANKKSILNSPLRNQTPVNEKIKDTTSLNQDVPESFREPSSAALEKNQVTNTNWSQPQDRGEDLINTRDPFLQADERNTEIPPELIQARAYQLYEQRGRDQGNDLADWFTAEEQLRGEITKRPNTDLSDKR